MPSRNPWPCPRTQLHFLYRRSRQRQQHQRQHASNYRQLIQSPQVALSVPASPIHPQFRTCQSARCLRRLQPTSSSSSRASSCKKRRHSSSASLSSILMRFICVHHNSVCVSTSCPLLCLLYSRQPVRPFFRCLLLPPTTWSKLKRGIQFGTHASQRAFTC